MTNHAQELFLLTTTLSQLSNKERVVQLFMESMNDIFRGYSFAWFTEKPIGSNAILEVCTRNNNYGFISYASTNQTDPTIAKLIYNATQLLAILIEKVDQENLLLDQKNHLQILVEEQTSELSQTNIQLEKELAERRLVEEALRESEEKYRTLIQKIQAAVVVHGSDGRIMTCNQKAQELLGLTENQLLGKSLVDPYWHFFRENKTIMPNEEYPVNRVFSSRSELRNYVVGVHRPCTNDNAWVLVNADPVRDSENKIKQVIVTFIDITNLKQAQEEIYKLNQELEQRVADRTAQLVVANKELEAFAYSISHDLRAPLRHIDGYVDLLVSRYRDSLDEKGMHYADTIAGSARRMGVLIDELLQFSRTGRTEMRKENMNMNQALQEVLTQLKESYAGRNIEWIIENLPYVRGDFALLRQVWSNLLENAIKYTRSREVARIEVSVREENDEIIFAVADNGVGYDMQYAGKLFGVFQRLHSEEEFEGSGIGLATVQRIINRHGGRVWAEGKVNEGATFYFSLPHSTGEDKPVSNS